MPPFPTKTSGPTDATNWDSFFDPDLVCVVGASSDPRRIGGRLVRYSLESGFGGRIVPVNPNRDEVFGVPALATLGDLEDEPDWVVIALGPEQVRGVLEEAAAVRAKNVLIVSSGFAEAGPEGRARQEEVVAYASAHGMRVLGPNANGFMNVAKNAFFAFTPVIDSARPVLGDIAVVTQSAAIGTYFVNWARHIGLGLHHWVHTGNESDVTLLEVARELLERREQKALALSFELLRDVELLREVVTVAADTATPLAVLQTGISTTGRRAAEAHTAALIQDDGKVVADLLSDAGAFVGRSLGDVMGFLQMAVHGTPASGRPRLGCVTTSGGIGVLMADAADAAGVEVPLLSAAFQDELRTIAPFCHPANPIDTTAQVINEPERFQALLEACASSPELDVVAAFIAHGLAGADDITISQVRTVGRGLRQRGAAGRLSAIGIITPDGSRSLQEQGISVFPEPRDLASALGSMAVTAAARSRFAIREARWPSLPDRRQVGMGTRPLDELESKRLLADAGAEVVPGITVSSVDDAIDAARGFGGAVVMKLISSELVHKAASGGVVADIRDDSGIADAFGRLHALRQDLDLVSNGAILVEPMVRGPELFVGAIWHPELGPILGVGAGGSGIEESRRVTWSWPVVDREGAQHAAEANLDADTAAVLGAAGAAGLASLAETLIGVLTRHEPAVVALECNPAIVTDDGRAVVVDALVELAWEPGGRG